MRIDEPKTPYQHPHSLRSPDALRVDGDAPLSPSSTNGAAAGTLPSELSLGERLTEISNEALQRREHEWESDDDEEEEEASMDASMASGGAATAAALSSAAAAAAATSPPTHRSNDSMSSTGSSIVQAHPHTHPHLHPRPHPHIETSEPDPLTSGAGSRRSSTSSAPQTPEQKHREFAAKRAGNYHSMGELLRARKQAALDDDDDDE